MNSPTWKEELLDTLALSRQELGGFPLSSAEAQAHAAMRDKYPAQINRRYAQLIDWQDPDDPIRAMLIPSPLEESSAGDWDTSGEADSTVVRGLQHKYRPTAVILLTQACAAHCRYCFRRRLLTKDEISNESITDLEEPLTYIASHREINNILLSGGDPLISSNGRLSKLMARFSGISHIRQIRFSTKIPAFLPSRILSDAAFVDALADFNDRFQIIIQCHFDHPRELTADTRACLQRLRQAGFLLTSQIALLRKVNDDPETLTDLFSELMLLGVVPQYLFHPRPVRHATHFQIPIFEGIDIVERAKQQCAGPAKRYRYVLVDDAGKAELVGRKIIGSKNHLILKWHELRMGLTKDNLLEMIPLDEKATWLPGN